MSFKLQNRRYTGSKQKLTDWIKKIVFETIDSKCTTFCDLFAGTGIITNCFINDFNEFYINDFLYSNYVVYNAFFSKDDYSEEKIIEYKRKFESLEISKIKKNYFYKKFGGKYFSKKDSLVIGEIRDTLEKNFNKKLINKREYYILLASLIYSFDKCANTVGHYEAYIKGKKVKDKFKFELINPIILGPNDKRKINIYKEDSNELVKKIKCDVVYIDPPYSSRQYSRFYHLLETTVKWDKPKLYGVAMKPKPENLSNYCSSKAIDSFRELISDLKCKYIFVSYNNTYDSNSKSSRNKMEIKDMVNILSKKGKTKIYEKDYNAFNAGKTFLNNHKELLLVTEVQND